MYLVSLPGALEQMKRKLFKITSSDSMVPIESCMAVANDEFCIAGELCSSSIAQGGPAPNFLAEWLYDFLAGGLKGISFDKSTKLDDARLEEFRVKASKLKINSKKSKGGFPLVRIWSSDGLTNLGMCSFFTEKDSPVPRLL